MPAKNKNEKISDQEIDRALASQFDLGFLVDQLRSPLTTDEEGQAVIFFPVIDVFRSFPQFEQIVKQVREELKINPEEVRGKLSSLVGSESFQNFLIESKSLARGDFSVSRKLAGTYDYNKVTNAIEGWKRENFPVLIKKTAGIRLKRFGKIPPTFQSVIEDYILFEKIAPVPPIFSGGTPKIGVKFDSEISEPYIEIRIYADSDPSKILHVNQLRKLQKALPTYFNPQGWSVSALTIRFLLYVLVRRIGLNQNRALQWLESKGLRSPDYQYVSQDISRFENIFIGKNITL